MGPNFSGSFDSMMQYTYFPRLGFAAASTWLAPPPWRTRPAPPRSTAARATLAARGCPPMPFGFAAFGAGLSLLFFRATAAFEAPPRRPRWPFLRLVDALGILAAPAALVRRRARFEDLAD